MSKHFLHHLRKNTIESFRGKNILWHFLAILLTYIIVVSGFDWFYFASTRSEPWHIFTISAGMIGFFVPVLLPIIIYFWEKKKDKTRSALMALSLAEAGLIAYLISIFYKTFTGRIQPEYLAHSALLDISREFNFGFLQHGIFWGWPSSHTAVAFAMSFALIMLYPKNKKVLFFAILYAFFIGLGVSVGIHWFSDFVAGAIVGSLVGIVVSKNFFSSTANSVF